MLRFAILLHQFPDAPRRTDHWDLLFESERGALLSWRLHAPLEAGPSISATRLPDHRRLYLDYEGPISGDRGHVRRIDAGTYETLGTPDPSGTWQVRLSGDLYRGSLTLDKASAKTDNAASGDSASPDISDEPRDWTITFHPAK